MELKVAQSSAVGMLPLPLLFAQRVAGVDALDSKFTPLDRLSSAGHARRFIVDAALPLPDLEDTHRQNPQQRRLAGILQPDHGNVHLRRPAEK